MGASYAPTELRICGEVIPRLSHVGENLLCLLSDEALGELLNSHADDVVSTADGKGHAKAGEIGVGEQLDIGRRVVAVRVHCIRPISAQGSREADVCNMR